MKTSLAALTAALTALTLTACGSGDSKSSDASTVASSNSASATTASASSMPSESASTSSALSSTSASTSGTTPVQTSTTPPTSSTTRPKSSAPATPPPATTKSATPQPTKSKAKLGGYCGKVRGLGVEAGSTTSCAFALDAARQAFANLDANKPSAPITVYSAAAGHNVTLQADYGAHGWNLTNASGAYVRVGLT